MQQLRGSRWRHWVVLAPLLLLELALSLYFFASDLLGFALPLFLAGAVSTSAAYAVLLRRWPRARDAWSRFALSLACAFAAFQIALLAFAIVSASAAGVSAVSFLPVVLIGANVFFFPVWLLLGALAYALVRLTHRQSPPTRPVLSQRAAPSRRRRSDR